jgi:hypothetical protein
MAFNNPVASVGVVAAWKFPRPIAARGIRPHSGAGNTVVSSRKVSDLTFGPIRSLRRSELPVSRPRENHHHLHEEKASDE